MNMTTICFWISLFIILVSATIIFIKFIEYIASGSPLHNNMIPSTIVSIILFTILIFCLILFGYYSSLFGTKAIQITYQE